MDQKLFRKEKKKLTARDRTRGKGHVSEVGRGIGRSMGNATKRAGVEGSEGDAVTPRWDSEEDVTEEGGGGMKPNRPG